EIVRQIETERINAEWALKEQTDKLMTAYASLEDEYFRERGIDIEDVSNRILMNLTGHKRPGTLWPVQAAVIIARSLSPSMLAALDYTKIKAFALESGGHTSHTAVLARSLSIPAVIQIENVTACVSSGERVIVDGNQGCLLVAPARKELARYKAAP